MKTKIWLTIVGGLGFMAADVNGQQSKPNVVFVFADQWRAQEVGYLGAENVLTPNLDKLAYEGTVLTTMVSNCPVSGAYRGSLLTGTYATTHGVFYNDKPLNPALKGLGEVFSENGYHTGYIGKWHVDGHGRTNFIPKERRLGFNYWKVLECTHDYNNSIYYGDNPQILKWDGYDAEAQTKDAVEYINNSDKTKPFVLILSWGPPHDPYDTAPQKYRDLYKDKSRISLRPNVPLKDSDKAREMLSGYYAHIAALDNCLGEIDKAIEKCGIKENTIFIFTSDHGDMLMSHGEINKQKPWDESILVPFVIRYPDGNLVNKRLDCPVNSPDIMPTLLALCGIEIPKSVEGNSFDKYLQYGTPPNDTCAIISCYVPFHQWNYKNGGKEFRGIRTPRYTYVETFDGPWLLYDNKADPYQMNNLVGIPIYQQLQMKLKIDLQNSLDAIGDEFKPAEYYMKKWNYSYDKEYGDTPFM